VTISTGSISSSAVASNSSLELNVPYLLIVSIDGVYHKNIDVIGYYYHYIVI